MKVVVEADGGSRGNPGPAGYGAVVLDENGGVLAERRGALGVVTNNVAEYRGLIAGLEAAVELGARRVDVRMDSKLVVEQMTGRWKIKHAALQELARRADSVVRTLDSVRFSWIPRAQNKTADRLANEAMDAAAAGELEQEELADAPAEQDVPAPAAQVQTAPAAQWKGISSPPTKLILLRHGQTALSVARKYSGLGDPELTEVGMAQAKAAAARLSTVDGVAAVLTSPLSRAAQTARPVADSLGVPTETVGELTELDFGEWEGLSFGEAAKRDPRLHRSWLSDPSVRAPGGESFDDVYARCERFLNDTVARYEGRTVVVVSHVTPIKTLLRLALAAGPSILFRLHLDLASVSLAEFYADGNASVTLVNDTSHTR